MRGFAAAGVKVWVWEVPDEEEAEHEEDEDGGADDGDDPFLHDSSVEMTDSDLGHILEIRTRKDYYSACPILWQGLVVQKSVNGLIEKGGL